MKPSPFIIGFALFCLAIGLVVLVLGGCASVSYETKDGTKVSYTRFLTSMDSIEASANKDGASVKANNVRAELEALLKILGGTK